MHAASLLYFWTFDYAKNMYALLNNYFSIYLRTTISKNNYFICCQITIN